MNVIYYLLQQFLNEEKIKSVGIILLSILLNVFQINGISYITANIITSMQKNNKNNVDTYFKYFIFASIVFIILYYFYKILQNQLIVKLSQWLKRELIKIIFKTNNENFSGINFTNYVTPLNRISNGSYILFYNVLTDLIPNLAFLLMISIYFIYSNKFFGSIFFLSNIFLIFYVYYYWNEMMEYRMKYENKVNSNESHIIDLFNNIDKIILRGTTDTETTNFSKLTEECVNAIISFYSNVNKHLFILTFAIYIIILCSIWYMIQLCYDKKLSVTLFITFFTILLLYRDRIISTIQSLPDYLEFIGRIDYVIIQFNEMIGDYNPNDDKKYENISLDFKKIAFENVSFKYPIGDKNVFDNLNITLNTNNKVLGIVGLSGNGKSTFTKMILKIYKCNKGKIYIDNNNIENIDSNYIRKNIIYVNQNSKLFDKKIIENILYGCDDVTVCKENLEKINRYKYIKNLLNSIDINNKNAGLAGENLSGGQRQIVNIINGLINPGKILILDEPTNALDGGLKRDVLQLINDFRNSKQCIIIITHDKEVYPLFDETITI
jgi:ABC-type bacteriocin/lantibiotic exporter with double-glycine peptidase domain